MLSVQQRPVIAFEKDSVRGAFEIVILAAPERPHERGEAGQSHPDRDRNQKEIIDHLNVPSIV